MPKDRREVLTDYLRDIHALEEQSLQQMESAPDIAGEPGLAAALREHLEETRTQEQSLRRLLHERGAEPSRTKDAVMRAGGEGFVLFARSQPDTPGKLATHALSYEALEWAAYDLLEQLAVAADEQDVAEVARAIRDQELRMMRKIESLLADTAAASISARGDDDLDDQLRSYLADAHAIEAQAIVLMKAGRKLTDDPVWSGLFDKGLAQAQRHQEVLEDRLDALDSSPSAIKDAALRIGGHEWKLFFQAQPDTAARYAAFVFAVQYLQIGGFEQLQIVAERAGDRPTEEAARRLVTEDRQLAGELSDAFDRLASPALSGVASTHE